MPLEIHSIYFMKTDGWTITSSKKWLKDHDYKIKKNAPHYIGDELRFNQIPKTKFKNFVTKILPNNVHLVLGNRK